MIYGEYETVELFNWDEAFKKHQEENREMEREREERLEKKEKQEKSWELLKECITYLKANEKTWKVEEEERLTERKRKEAKNRKNQLQEKRSQERQLQLKITETWRRLPEHEQRHLKRILDLREMKVNMWKKWRRDDYKKKD